MERTNIRAPALFYQLQANDNDPLDGDGPWTFSGIAVGEDSILTAPDGTPVLFSGEVLAEYGHTQADKPVSVDHPDDENGEPSWPPPTDQTTGRVIKAGHVPGKGLGYEMTVHDPEIAQGLAAGSYEVSVHPAWKDFAGRDPDTGAHIPEDLKFFDLSVVSQGMDRSNEARPGPSRELAAWAIDGLEDELANMAASDETDTRDREGLIASTVRRTLRSVGIDVDETNSDEAAESAADTDDTSFTMEQQDRDQLVELTAEHSEFSEKALEAMDDDTLAHTYQLVAEDSVDETDDGDGAEEQNTETSDDDGEETDDTPLSEMSVGDLASALEDHGFVTESGLEEAQASATKEELADEIIASSPDWEADDREHLVESPKPVLEKEHKRAQRLTAAALPGAAGFGGSLTAGGSGSGDDLDEYGTGVSGGD